jgi:hypothetical protein
MDDKITIIEGPPPVFEAIQDGWPLSLNEGPSNSIPALTRLRTFNGAQLVERCYRAWRGGAPIHLHYRDEIGLEQQAPILAARNLKTEEGDVLFLWIYLDSEKVEVEFDPGDDDAETGRD